MSVPHASHLTAPTDRHIWQRFVRDLKNAEIEIDFDPAEPAPARAET